MPAEADSSGSRVAGGSIARTCSICCAWTLTSARMIPAITGVHRNRPSFTAPIITSGTGMAFLGLLGLLALAYLLVPVLSFVRMLQLGRELIEVRRRLDLVERRLHDAGPSPQRATAAEPAMPPPASAPPQPGFASPRLPEWA